MRISAETFTITPKPGGTGLSRTAAPVEHVFSGLQTTLTLLDEANRKICIVSTHAVADFVRFSNVIRPAVANALKIDVSQVLCFASHNHCAFPPFNPAHKLAAFGKPDTDEVLTRDDLTPEGRNLVDLACQTAVKLPEKLKEAEIHWGLGHERRISYNRKGHRTDGSTNMIREEDRLLLGADFNGDINDDAAVVAFIGRDGKPISFLTYFTGHPVTAFHPEHPVIFGEYPQVACDELSNALGGVPVGFLQGCAGDVSAKGMLANQPIEQSVADSTRFGKYLGETFVQAARSLTRCHRQDLSPSLQNVNLPFAGVPPLWELDEQLADLRAFVGRCEANDPDTRACQGLNFPSNMTPRYRAALVKPLLNWVRWAKGFHEPNPPKPPTGVDVEVAALRLGDVGIVGLPCEPFDAIGRRMKRNSPCALTLPCGYMNDSFVYYVPDSGNNGDNDYQSAFYRYTTSLLPYAQPAGDKLADEGVRLLREMTITS